MKKLKQLCQNNLFVFLVITAIFLVIISTMYAQNQNPIYLTVLMLTPALSAAAANVLTHQKNNTDILKLKWKQNKKSLVFSYFAPPLLAAVGIVIYFVLFSNQWNPMGSSYALSLEAGSQNEYLQKLFMVIPLAVLLNPLGGLLQCFTEEYAWRGFLLPKLMNYFSVKKAVLISGLIWGIWHSPIILMGYNYGSENAVAGIFMMILFCMVIGTIESALFLKSKSIWPAVFFHAALNGMDKWKASALLMNQPANSLIGPDVVGIIGMIGFILLAVGCWLKLSKSQKIN